MFENIEDTGNNPGLDGVFENAQVCIAGEPSNRM